MRSCDLGAAIVVLRNVCSDHKRFVGGVLCTATKDCSSHKAFVCIPTTTLLTNTKTYQCGSSKSDLQTNTATAQAFEPDPFLQGCFQRTPSGYKDLQMFLSDGHKTSPAKLNYLMLMEIFLKFVNLHID